MFAANFALHVPKVLVLYGRNSALRGYNLLLGCRFLFCNVYLWVYLNQAQMDIFLHERTLMA